MLPDEYLLNLGVHPVHADVIFTEADVNENTHSVTLIFTYTTNNITWRIWIEEINGAFAAVVWRGGNACFTYDNKRQLANLLNYRL